MDPEALLAECGEGGWDPGPGGGAVKGHRANVSTDPAPPAPARAPRAQPRQHHEVRGSIENLHQPSVPPQDSAQQPPVGGGLELEGDGGAANKLPSELDWIEAAAAERLAQAGVTVPSGGAIAAIEAAHADVQLCVRMASLVRELSVAVATPVPEINACVEDLILHGLSGQVVGVLGACLKTRTPPRNHVNRILMAARYPELQPWQHQVIHEWAVQMPDGERQVRDVHTSEPLAAEQLVAAHQEQLKDLFEQKLTLSDHPVEYERRITALGLLLQEYDYDDEAIEGILLTCARCGRCPTRTRQQLVLARRHPALNQHQLIMLMLWLHDSGQLPETFKDSSVQDSAAVPDTECRRRCRDLDLPVHPHHFRPPPPMRDPSLFALRP